MAGMLCCNPINVDDDIDDMELEDVWELQRSRSKSKSKSKSTKQPNKTFTKPKNKKNQMLNPKPKPIKPNKGLSLKRVKSTGVKKNKTVNNVRSVSALKARTPSPLSPPFNARSRSTSRPRPPVSSGWGLNFGGGTNEKKVSISNYVEKIDYPPEKKIEGRGRPVRGPPVGRSRSKSTTGKTKKKRFGWGGKKKKEQRQDEYESPSDSDSSYDNDYDERPNFFSMM